MKNNIKQHIILNKLYIILAGTLKLFKQKYVYFIEHTFSYRYLIGIFKIP